MAKVYVFPFVMSLSSKEEIMTPPCTHLAMAWGRSTPIGRENHSPLVTATLASLVRIALKVLTFLSLSPPSIPDHPTVMCPKGDDPITRNQDKYTFQLSVDSVSPADSLSGDLILHFQDDHITLPINSDLNNVTCSDAFSSSKKINNITCLFQNNSRTSVTVRIIVNSWPLFPQQNNIYTHNGVPEITDFTCDASKMTSAVTCNFNPIFFSNVEGATSLALCSNCVFNRV